MKSLTHNEMKGEKTMATKKYRTKIDLLHFPAGTQVTCNDEKDVIGKTGKLLCDVPTGGALFYSEDELEKVE